MAAKGASEFPLSIVLQAVDHATGPLKAANARIEAAFKPYKGLSKQLGNLWENSGLKGLAGSIGNVGREIGSLAMQFGVLVGAAGLAARALMGVYDEGDKLGEVADRLGMNVDALSQLRYAGKRTGVEMEEMDAALETFSKGLGQAKAGTGRFIGFLAKVSPVLAKQVKGAKSNEEAFMLMADAMAKVTDPAKRAALATAAFGDAKLAPLLAKGSAGVEELRKRYLDLNGSQEKFAAASGLVTDATDDLGEAWTGVKRAIATEMAPAFKQFADQASAWLAAHREQIAQWAEDFGTKLPGRIQALIDSIKSIGAAIKPVWRAIGGAKGALIIFAAVKLAPLASALLGIVGALWKVVMALRAAGVAAGGANAAAGGWLAKLGGGSGLAGGGLAAAVLVDAAAFAYLGKQIYDAESAYQSWEAGQTPEQQKRKKAIEQKIDEDIRGERVQRVEAAVEDIFGAAPRRAPYAVGAMVNLPGTGRGPLLDEMPPPIGQAPVRGKVDVSVNLTGAPPGTRTTFDSEGDVGDVDLNMGPQVLVLP